MSFSPAYRIATERLILRCYSPVDAPIFHTAMLANIEHLKTFMPWAHDEPKALADRIATLRYFRGQFDLNQDYVYGIFDPEEKKLLGGSGLHPRRAPGSLEIGYWIDKDHTGRGYATEVSAALTKIAFELHEARRVEIHCDPANLASAAVPRKLGFTHEGTLRADTIFLDQRHDSMVWSLLPAEYPNSAASHAQISAWDAAGVRVPDL